MVYISDLRLAINAIKKPSHETLETASLLLNLIKKGQLLYLIKLNVTGLLPIPRTRA
jgi:hypothetical protein